MLPLLPDRLNGYAPIAGPVATVITSATSDVVALLGQARQIHGVRFGRGIDLKFPDQFGPVYNNTAYMRPTPPNPNPDPSSSRLCKDSNVWCSSPK